MQCVKSVSYSFLVNDSAHGRLIPSRGIRQGDPLSPYIFILCGEVLSGLCRRAQRSGHMSGLRVAIPAPRLNHLLFADDTMFFLDTDEDSCFALLEILQQYKVSSGQLINASKSSISFSAKTPQVIRQRVKQCLGIEQEGGVGKYLGLPEHFGRRKKDLFTSIVDRIRQKAVSWASRQLSSAGKLVMLKAVLTAVPSFAMTCFELPVSLCNRIQTVLTRFWWDASPDQRKMCWVAWERITTPKGVGGLGVRDIQAFNVALLAKQAWRILTKPECLLSKILRAKYCNKAHFLQSKPPKAASHGWRGILKGRDLLLTHLSKAIGDGEDTRIWKDPWLSSTTPLRPIGPVTEDNQDLVVADLFCRGSMEWNVSKIKSMLPQYLHIIQSIKPSITGSPDSYVWLASRSGLYSAKSGYYAATTMDNHTPAANQVLFKTIWNSKVSPKLQLFLWKITQGAIAIGENLAKRGLLANIACRYCGEYETTEHIFLHCNHTRQVWASQLWKLNFNPSDCSSFSEAFLSSVGQTNLPPRGVAGNLFPWICWGIWTARNYRIFESRDTPPAETLARSIRNAREWENAQAISTSSSHVHSLHSHQVTNTAVIDCFTDAAWQVATNRAGCGWIFLNQQKEHLLQGTSTFNHTASPLVAEALAVRSALLHAIEAGYSRICIKSDCQALVAFISSKYHPTDLYGITRDIEHLSLSFDYVVFTFISRNLNVMADSLAKSVLYVASAN